MEYAIREATAERWEDVTRVMGVNGAYGGCWCTFWRLTNREANANSAEDNRAAQEALVRSDAPAGLLLYADGEPVGWCSVAPRPAFPRLFHTKGIVIADPENASVWSVVCIYVKKDYRQGGLANRLLDAAIAYAREHGAAVIEGYPVADPSQGRKAGLATGTISRFARASFVGDGRPATGRRVVMRRAL